MRLIFDLYPCQTGSRYRGIGRFTLSLAKTMAQLRGTHEMLALGNGMMHEDIGFLRDALQTALPRGHISAYTHPDQSYFNNEAAYAMVGNTLIHGAYQALIPDAIIYPTPFEGWHEPGITALPINSAGTALRTTVLYDFIPYLFPQQYFTGMPGYKEWYHRRLATLHQFDLLLAISEATRQDAIDILKISPDRIVNISGAASPDFGANDLQDVSPERLARFGIVRPFVLYTGNVDYRKNQEGMLSAYAALPEAIRKTHQLVLSQVGDLSVFRRKARSLGLMDDDFIVTGHVSDKELIALYSQCRLFVFPSLYEGFGLPILEAMSCGTPVIAGNNSSLPEVVGRSDLLFDASDPAAISRTMEKVLLDETWREELVRYSKERATCFSWERSASLAWQAIEQALAHRSQSLSAVPVPRQKKARIAVVCPLQLSDHGSIQYFVGLIPQLSRYFDIDIFIEEGVDIDLPMLQAGFEIYPHTRLLARRDRYAMVIYHLADTPHCGFMLPLIEQFEGIVALHDPQLEKIAHETATHANDILANLQGLQGLLARFRQSSFPSSALIRHIAGLSQHLILNDLTSAELLKTARNGDWLPPRTLISHRDRGADTLAYQRAIEAAMAWDRSHILQELGDALECDEPSDSALHAIALHASRNRLLRKGPRLLVDVTQLARTDARSGIQRVVRNISRELGALAELEIPIELVRLHDGGLVRPPAIIHSLFGIPEEAVPLTPIAIQPGDILLMIDSSWEQYPDFLSIFQSVRQMGGMIATVVYDIIPLRFPQTCDANLVAVFQRWFRLAAEQSDMLVCISAAVADEVKRYLQEQQCPVKDHLAIRHWHLGADVLVTKAETSIRELVTEMVSDTSSPLFLMVGTVEPRKGHDFALDAFEALWRDGENFRLCIAGGEGWRVEQTMKRIRQHPQLNKKLFFVEKFTDAEINVCYQAATGLIAASIAEGFGLPIVEAAQHGVAALASDIPVFHEVGGDGARYFSLNDPQNLAQAVRAFVELSAQERTALAGKVRISSWKDSARELSSAMGILGN